MIIAVNMNQGRNHDVMESIMLSPGPVPGSGVGRHIDWRAG